MFKKFYSAALQTDTSRWITVLLVALISTAVFSTRLVDLITSPSDEPSQVSSTSTPQVQGAPLPGWLADALEETVGKQNPVSFACGLFANAERADNLYAFSAAQRCYPELLDGLERLDRWHKTALQLTQSGAFGPDTVQQLAFMQLASADEAISISTQEALAAITTLQSMTEEELTAEPSPRTPIIAFHLVDSVAMYDKASAILGSFFLTCAYEIETCRNAAVTRQSSNSSFLNFDILVTRAHANEITAPASLNTADRGLTFTPEERLVILWISLPSLALSALFLLGGMMFAPSKAARDNAKEMIKSVSLFVGGIFLGGFGAS